MKQRLFLYFVTIVFAAMAIWNASAEVFHFAVGIVVYVCAAVTLAFSCYCFILDIRRCEKHTGANGIRTKTTRSRMAEDYRKRTFRSAMVGLRLNVLFAVFYGAIGIISRSAWFGTLAAYYILLTVMRWNIIRCNEKMSPTSKAKERIRAELVIYRKGGISFLVMTIVLMGAVVLLLTVEEGKSYPGFTIYAIAAYTFYRITMSIIHLVKTRKMKSVLLMAIRDVGYVESLVSVLVLQTAMFAAFGDDNLQTIHLMNGLTGGGVCLLVLATGINEIVQSTRLMRKHRERE